MSPRRTIIAVGIVAAVLLVNFPTWKGFIKGPGFDADLDLGIASIFHPPTPAIPKMAGPSATVSVWIDWGTMFWNLGGKGQAKRVLPHSR